MENLGAGQAPLVASPDDYSPNGDKSSSSDDDSDLDALVPERRLFWWRDLTVAMGMPTCESVGI